MNNFEQQEDQDQLDEQLAEHRQQRLEPFPRWQDDRGPIIAGILIAGAAIIFGLAWFFYHCARP